MRPKAPPVRRSTRGQRALVVAVVILVALALSAMVAFVWYPTTLQPNVVLTDVASVGTRCAPVSGGGYANRFNLTFDLVNSGRADGDVWVQFLLGNWSMGYQNYFVRQGSQVSAAGMIVWEVHPTPTDCGPLEIPGPPVVVLASVARSPPIDERDVIYATVTPITTIGFAAAMLGGLALLARRRGISLFQDLPREGWGVAYLIIFAAYSFAGIVTAALTIPYNYPDDWTPLAVYVPVLGSLGAVALIVACRAVLRAGRDSQAALE